MAVHDPLQDFFHLGGCFSKSRVLKIGRAAVENIDRMPSPDLMRWLRFVMRMLIFFRRVR
ncbi:MAG: hypothetical protein C4523_04045 [Myxococcales bacterium]|nr:MAG: hypothetical protein C4523_04045 [Myxococcales bacterium]